VQADEVADRKRMMSEEPSQSSKPINAIICIDDDVFGRWRAVLRHLCVGLIDHIAGIRLLTTTADAEELSLGPVQIVPFVEAPWPLKTRRYRQLHATLAARPPSVVHAMSAGAYALGGQVAADFNADLVFEVTSLADVQAATAFQYDGPTRVICASQPLFDACIEAGMVEGGRVSLIRPGVSAAAQPTCFREATRQATILSTVPLLPGSGVDTLLHAVHMLCSRNHDFLTFLVGQGPDESRLRKLCGEMGLGSAVVFAQPEGDIQRAMVGADVFVQPTVESALSVYHLQALAQGMAVVAVEGGVCDAFIRDVTATIATESTAPDLAGAIERLLMDHTLARRLAAGAIEHMRKHHTMSAMADQTAEVYRELALQRATFRLPTSS
jgi:hypothetical protein